MVLPELEDEELDDDDDDDELLELEELELLDDELLEEVDELLVEDELLEDELLELLELGVAPPQPTKKATINIGTELNIFAAKKAGLFLADTADRL